MLYLSWIDGNITILGTSIRGLPQSYPKSDILPEKWLKSNFAGQNVTFGVTFESLFGGDPESRLLVTLSYPEDISALINQWGFFSSLILGPSRGANTKRSSLISEESGFPH